jgi:hypothetical protein
MALTAADKHGNLARSEVSGRQRSRNRPVVPPR